VQHRLGQDERRPAHPRVALVHDQAGEAAMCASATSSAVRALAKAALPYPHGRAAFTAGCAHRAGWSEREGGIRSSTLAWIKAWDVGVKPVFVINKAELAIRLSPARLALAYG